MTPDQIMSIIMLLQAFGVDLTVIAQVRTDLTPQQVVIPQVQESISPAVSSATVSVPNLSFVDTPLLTTTSVGQQVINWTTTVPASVEVRYMTYPTGIDSEIIEPKFYAGDRGASQHLTSFDMTATSSSYTIASPTIKEYLLDLTANGQEIMWIGRTNDHDR